MESGEELPILQSGEGDFGTVEGVKLYIAFKTDRDPEEALNKIQKKGE